MHRNQNAMLCRFYQAGNCKFGNNCRYSHDGNFNNNTGYNNYYRGNYNYNKYHVDNRKKITNDDDVTIVMKYIKHEIEQAENGNMWPLTCMGPINGFGNIQGFEDISPEELRLEFYTSCYSGTIDIYKQNINHVLNIVSINRNMFKEGTKDAYNISKALLSNNLPQSTGSTTKSALDTFSFRTGPQNISEVNQHQSSMFAMPSGNPSLSFNTFSFCRPQELLNVPSASMPAVFEESEMSVNTEFDENSGQTTSSFNKLNFVSNPSVFNGDITSPNEKFSFMINSAYLYKTYVTAEMEAFNAEKFKLGNIPIKSPPREVCFPAVNL